MRLFTAPELAQLRANGRAQAQATRTNTDTAIDFRPVIKLFTPDAGCAWLLTEIDPDDEDRAFGLCDLGLGHPELGYVSLAELRTVRGRLGLPIERDLSFRASKSLAEYAAAARAEGAIRTGRSGPRLWQASGRGEARDRPDA
jgi:hypothetical protein